jgi:hypothetical protein
LIILFHFLALFPMSLSICYCPHHPSLISLEISKSSSVSVLSQTGLFSLTISPSCHKHIHSFFHSYMTLLIFLSPFPSSSDAILYRVLQK